MAHKHVSFQRTQERAHRDSINNGNDNDDDGNDDDDENDDYDDVEQRKKNKI